MARTTKRQREKTATVPVNKETRRAQPEAQPKAQPQPCRFLGLPIELRNMVYKYLLPQVHQIRVQPTGTGRDYVVSSHPINWASRKLHAEFSDALRLYSFTGPTSVVGEVVDFNFYALEAFLKRVIGKEGNLHNFDRNFVSNGTRSQRKLAIALTITSEWCRSPDAKQITRWFTFLDRQISAGNIRTEYEFFLDYHFKNVEDRAAAKKVMKLMASGQKRSGRWPGIVKCLYHWEKFGGDQRKAEAHARHVERQEKMDLGAVERYEDELSDWGGSIVDSDEEEDYLGVVQEYDVSNGDGEEDD